jgi:hypothetical protein
MVALGGKVIGVRLMSWRTGVVIRFKAGSLLGVVCMNHPTPYQGPDLRVIPKALGAQMGRGAGLSQNAVK